MLARDKKHSHEEEKTKAALRRDVLARDLHDHEITVAAAEQKRGVAQRELQALKRYAATLGIEVDHDETPVAEDRGAPESAEVAHGLARELLDEECRVLAEARVVGATLTKTYVAKALKGRRFDVAIVDEASMASLPALYVAATRADQRLILIGDPRQLPPIVKSKEQAAREWLGRDIFEAAGVGLNEARDNRHHAVMLDEQRRMRPEVSLAARRHVYDNLLRDHPDAARLPPLRIEPLPDHPLVLCDTSAARPVCSRPSTSRVNVYHAICTFLLGRRALRSLAGASSAPSENGQFRVGLITPYRKQAELLQRLIGIAGLEREMRAGTVHRFQGLECDVVVFDTVESEGLPLTPLTAGGAGTEAQRLTNVAITRGRHKLSIVANQDHLKRRLGGGRDGNGARGRHTLWDTVREAAASAIVDSRELVSLDLSGAGGPDGALVGAIARLAQMFAPLTGDEFDSRLQEDVAQQAAREVLIVSPYVTERRVAALLPMLRETVGRDVRVRVVTGRRSANRDDRVSASALAQLIEAGVEHTERPGLHQKVVFVDSTIAYVGSLNTRSYSGSTQELVLRIADLKLARSLRAHLM